jgi:hypothetical protein
MATESVLEFARKRAVWAAAGLLLLAAAAGEHVAADAEIDPLARAAAFLESREPLAALAELDRLADSPRANDPEVQVVRGKAEHALGQFGPAFADFAAAAKHEPRALDTGAVAALAEMLDSEAFPPVWRPALLKVLGEQVGRAAAPALRPLLSSERARSRDALHVLEVSGAATDEDRLTVARSDLLDPHSSCAARRTAVRRLALVGGPEASALLNGAAQARACGSAEARDALRRRTTAKVAEAR